MGEVPSVLIIEKARFAANVLIEECERPGKTTDNQHAIIRYQRRADVGVIEQIGRFFSDLIHGVTRAKGIVCDKPDLPATLHIRGERCNVIKDAGSNKASVAPLPTGQARHRAAFSALTIQVHEVSLHDSDPALAHKVAEELRDRFEADGEAIDLIAVDVFLALDSEPNFEMTPQRIAQLMHFSDAMARMSGNLKRELGKDVLAHVLDRMQRWQDSITAIRAPGPNEPTPAYPGFRFKALAAFGATTTATAPATSPLTIEAAHLPQVSATAPEPAREAPADEKSAVEKSTLERSARVAPSLAAPPPPPPPPAVKPPVIGHATDPSAAPDARVLNAALSRLKPTQAHQKKAVTPADEDNSTAGILARAMAMRRTDLKEEANNQQDDDEWL